MSDRDCKRWVIDGDSPDYPYTPYREAEMTDPAFETTPANPPTEIASAVTRPAPADEVTAYRAIFDADSQTPEFAAELATLADEAVEEAQAKFGRLVERVYDGATAPAPHADLGYISEDGSEALRELYEAAVLSAALTTAQQREERMEAVVEAARRCCACGETTMSIAVAEVVDDATRDLRAALTTAQQEAEKAREYEGAIDRQRVMRETLDYGTNLHCTPNRSDTTDADYRAEGFEPCGASISDHLPYCADCAVHHARRYVREVRQQYTEDCIALCEALATHDGGDE